MCSKRARIGAHQLSGAIMNPKALAELVPDFEKSAPLDTRSPIRRALLYRKKIVPFSHHRAAFSEQGELRRFAEQIVKWLGEKWKPPVSTFSRNLAARN